MLHLGSGMSLRSRVFALALLAGLAGSLGFGSPVFGSSGFGSPEFGSLKFGSLEFEPAALGARTIPRQAGNDSQAQPAGARVTFNRDIAPIMFRTCSTCHRPGEAAPFSLLTYSDAKRHAR